ncbi:MAG: hypothetical protein H6718_11530 [Polyangiaceae bacterium]|nr:hypothetical protein [Polyangiaceae bacterium]
MSRGIMIYSVDEAALKAALGSNDPELLDRLEKVCSDSTWPQAMQLVKAGACRGDAEQQIFAFEALCQHFGVELDNGAVSPIRQATIQDADQALLAHPARSRWTSWCTATESSRSPLASDFLIRALVGGPSENRRTIAEDQPPEHDDADLESILLQRLRLDHHRARPQQRPLRLHLLTPPPARVRQRDAAGAGEGRTRKISGHHVLAL